MATQRDVQFYACIVCAVVNADRHFGLAIVWLLADAAIACFGRLERRWNA